MADTTIQKQGEVFISQSEYDALRLAGNLQSNTKYHITKTPKTGVDSLEQMNLLNGDKTVTYDTTDGMAINGQARFTYNGGTTKDVPMDIEVPIVAGEGITIDKVNGQEKVEVRLDTAVTDGKYVPKRTTTSSDSYAYVYSPSGDNGLRICGDANGRTIPFRFNDGRVKVGTAVEDSDAMPKKQVEDGFVPKILTTDYERCYVTNLYGSQGTRILSHNADAYTVPLRSDNGSIKVGTPVGVNDATTKAYVDAQTVYTHYVCLTNANYDGEILLTIPAKIQDPITDLTGLTNAVPSAVTQISATGYLHNKNDTSVPTVMVFGIIFNIPGRPIVARATYQTFTLTDQTITSTTTSSDMLIKNDGFWTVKDVVS